MCRIGAAFEGDEDGERKLVSEAYHYTIMCVSLEVQNTLKINVFIYSFLLCLDVSWHPIVEFISSPNRPRGALDNDKKH